MHKSIHSYYWYCSGSLSFMKQGQSPFTAIRPTEINDNQEDFASYFPRVPRNEINVEKN